jgi:hypothetical protein
MTIFEVAAILFVAIVVVPPVFLGILVTLDEWWEGRRDR